MKLTWNESLLLGQQEMDTTHKEFVRLLTRVSDALSVGATARAFEVFRHLRQHTEDHFAQEEQWMEVTDCPSTASHTAQHATVLKLMDHVLLRPQDAAGCGTVRLVVDELAQWFVLHTDGHDAQLAAHMRSVGFSACPGRLARRLRAVAEAC